MYGTPPPESTRQEGKTRRGPAGGLLEEGLYRLVPIVDPVEGPFHRGEIVPGSRRGESLRIRTEAAEALAEDRLFGLSLLGQGRREKGRAPLLQFLGGWAEADGVLGRGVVVNDPIEDLMVGLQLGRLGPHGGDEAFEGGVKRLHGVEQGLGLPSRRRLFVGF